MKLSATSVSFVLALLSTGSASSSSKSRIVTGPRPQRNQRWQHAAFSPPSTVGLNAIVSQNANNAIVPSTLVRKRALAQYLLLRAIPTNESGSSSASFDRTNLSFGRTSPSLAPSTSPTLSPTGTLSMMVDEQREFELNLGRAIDTLRADYPKILTRNPDYKIYHTQLEVIDPTGVSLHGLGSYKRAFSFIHAVINMFYDEGSSGLTFRLGYDWARKCIRVSWNVELVPKRIYGGTSNTLHVDGISEYYLERSSGLITEHRVSHLLINDAPVRPVNGIFHALEKVGTVDPGQCPEGVPVFSKLDTEPEWTHLKFQTWNPLQLPHKPSSSSSSLFAESPHRAITLSDHSEYESLGSDQVPYDRDALQRKNASRKKFGMPPLTPEEFVKIEEEVRRMDALNKKKAAYLAEQIAQQAQARKEKKENFLSNIFGGALKNGCESNFDCERPQVCCDVGFKKICCSNGLGIVEGVPVEKYQRGLLRVPLPNDNYDY